MSSKAKFRKPAQRVLAEVTVNAGDLTSEQIQKNQAALGEIFEEANIKAIALGFNPPYVICWMQGRAMCWISHGLNDVGNRKTMRAALSNGMTAMDEKHGARSA